MSYQSILEIIKSKPIEYSHIALGMRKPGEKHGIWLFGERHSKEEETSSEYHGFENAITVDEILKDHVKDTILVYEGMDSPGQEIFAEAPDHIKDIVEVMTPDVSYIVTKRKDDVITDLDENGYTLNTVSEEMLQDWKDAMFWEMARYDLSEMEYVGQKFTSKGGVSINIENKIRSYFMEIIGNIVKGEHINHNDMFTVMAWSLCNKSREYEKTSDNEYKNSGLSGFQTHIFYQNFILNLKKRIPNYEVPVILDMLSKFKMLLREDPYPIFLEQIPDLVNLFMFFTMDINIINKLNNHPEMDFVSICGAQHTINQYIALSQYGYELEHIYVSDMDFITPNDKKNKLKYKSNMLKFLK